jgi:2,3-bisphosphoglycerate-independent phosphoglycerate mutase
MLKRLTEFPGYQGPVVVVVMDGFGISPTLEGNAIAQAKTPVLDELFRTSPNTLLKAHGKAVGLPSDEDMGNSEVGHNAIGSGQVYEQGASLVSQAIADGRIWEREAWKDVVRNVVSSGGTLHFLGLFSDGNVHSHVNHLVAMIKRAKQEGVRKARVHILLDGRDVGETSALEYVLPFENFLEEVRSADFDVRIASGGGRMKITMDHYEADWSMVERGWQTHVLGQGKQFASAEEAIHALRSEHPGVIDQVQRIAGEHPR